MMMFKVLVRDVKLTLDCLKPVIDEIAEYNRVLNQPTEEVQSLKLKMEEGDDLVRKCSKVGACSFYKKKTRDIKETLDSVKNIETVVQRIEGNISAMQISP
ncbi:hypothetical protein M0R45_026968 [Rubus argutus]|uniref:RPW8 domain-containing protein n=1 Tax=Rubus argutus TaxID=59490 RepID=A0AAW1X0S4_RUBAR